MVSNNQIKINKIDTADCGWTKPSTTFNELDNRVNELITHLKPDAPNSSLLADEAINFLEKRGFQRLSDEEAALIKNSLIQRDSRYLGILVKEGLFAEVCKDYHWVMGKIPETTHSFAKINFRNREGTYIRSNCFCGIN